MASPRIIKKYTNRRLYDTTTSKYIVLTDVVAMIREGEEFVIEDAKTGEDLTRSILNQVIFEQETRPQDFLFPLEFQKQLIKLYGDGYGQLIPDFLTQSMAHFMKERNRMASAWGDMVNQGADTFIKQAENLAQKNMDMFQKALDVFSGSKDEPKETIKEPDPDQVKNLQAQIDALQAELNKLSK
ncbi:MAG: polyhydroxyalkanoate synthesis repressor PhaR [Pseudomonadota bacterium]